MAGRGIRLLQEITSSSSSSFRSVTTTNKDGDTNTHSNYNSNGYPSTSNRSNTPLISTSSPASFSLPVDDDETTTRRSLPINNIHQPPPPSRSTSTHQYPHRSNSNPKRSISSASSIPYPPVSQRLSHAPPGLLSPNSLQLARSHALAEIQARKEAAKEFHVAVGVRARPLSVNELQMGDTEAWTYDLDRQSIAEILHTDNKNIFPSSSSSGSQHPFHRSRSPSLSNISVTSQSITGGGTGGGPSVASVVIPPAHHSLAKELVFDYIFPPSSRTETVYTSIGAPIVNSVLEGFNGTIFAYGQTGSGKTHSLMGTPTEPGVILLAVQDIFNGIEAAAANAEFIVRASYLEIYNEELRDLLYTNTANTSLPAFIPTVNSSVSLNGGSVTSSSPVYNLTSHSHHSHLRIVDNPITGPYVKGATEEIVLSPQRVYELLAIGEMNRHVAATNMNYRSSRSHTIFKLIIECKLRLPSSAVSSSSSSASSSVPYSSNNGSIVRVSNLYIIDLAGSERVTKSHAEGLALKETGLINSSLLTLGVVINKLANGEAHIPYRDSKLTRILTSSLGGNARTGVLVTLSPATWHLSETRSSLFFAQRAMHVINRAKINEIADEPAIVAQFKREIAQLRAALLENRGGSVITADGEIVSAEEMLERIRRQNEQSMEQLQTMVQTKNDELIESSHRLTEFLQLLFVVTHAMGHIKSAPFIVDTIMRVASGLITTESAIKEIVLQVPGFRRRMTRLLRGEHIRAVTVPATNGSTISSSAELSNATVPLVSAGQQGLLELVSSLNTVSSIDSIPTAETQRSSLPTDSPSATDASVPLKPSFLSSSIGSPLWMSPRGSYSHTGTDNSTTNNTLATSILKFGPSTLLKSPRVPLLVFPTLPSHPVSNDGSKYPSTVTDTKTSQNLLSSAMGLPYLPITSSPSANTLSSSSTNISNRLTYDNVDENSLNEEKKNDSSSNKTIGSRSSTPVLFDQDLQMDDILHPHLSSENIAGTQVRFESITTVAQRSPNTVHASASSLSVEYFSPQSFGRQILALLEAKETLDKVEEEHREILRLRESENQQANRELQVLRDRFEEMESLLHDMEKKTQSLTESSTRDTEELRTTKENSTLLQQRLQDMEFKYFSLLQEHTEMQTKSSTIISEANSTITKLENDVAIAVKAKEQAIENFQVLDANTTKDRETREQLAKEVTDAKETITSLRIDYGSLFAKMEALSNEAAYANERCSRLQEDNVSVHQMNQELRQRLTSAEAAVAEAVQLRVEAETASRARERAREDGAREVIHARGATISAEARAAAAESEAYVSRMTLAEITGKANALETALNELRTEAAQDRKEREESVLAQAEVTKERDQALERARTAERELTFLRKQLDTREEELRITGSNKENAERNLLVARVTSSTSETRLKEMEGKMEALHDSVAELRNTLTEKETLVVTLNAKLDSKRTSVAELTAVLDDMKARLASMHHTVDERGKRCTELEKELVNLRGTFTLTQQNLDETKTSRDHIIDGLQLRIQELERRVQEGEETATTTLSNRLSIENERAHLLAQTHELQQKIRELVTKETTTEIHHNSEVDRLHRNLASLTVENQQANQRIQGLEDQLTTMNKLYDDNKLACSKQEAINHTLKLELDENKIQITTLQAHSALLTSRLDEKEKQLAHSKAAMGVITAARDAENLRANTAEARMRTLEHHIQHIETKLRDEQNRYTQLTRDYDTVQNTLLGHENRINELSSTLASTLETLTNVRQDISNTVQTKDYLQTEYDTLQQKYRLLDTTYHTLEQEHKRLADQLHVASIDNSKLLSKVQEYESSVSTHQATIMHYRNDLELLQQQYVTCQGERQQHYERAVTNEQALRVAQDTIQELRSEVQKVHSDILISQREFISLSQRYDVLQNTKEQTDNEIVTLRTVLNTERQEMLEKITVVSLQNQNLQETMQQDVSQLRQQVMDAETRRDQTLAELMKVQSENKDYQLQLQTMEKEYTKSIAMKEQQYQTNMDAILFERDAAIASRDRTSHHLAIMEEERNNFFTRCNALQETVDKLWKDIEALTKLKEEKETEIMQHAKEYTAHREEFTNQEKTFLMEKTLLTEEVQKLTKDIETNKLRIKDLEASQSLASKSINALRKELNHQVEETAKNKDTIIDLHKQISTITDERTSALADTALANKELDIAQGRIVELTKEIGMVRADATESKETLHNLRMEMARTLRTQMMDTVLPTGGRSIGGSLGVTGVVNSSSSSNGETTPSGLQSMFSPMK